jgi:hypothetical protein
MSVEDFQERDDEYFNRFYGEGDPLDLQIKALQIHIDKGVLTREEAIEALAMLQGQDVEEFEDMFLDVNKILSDGGYDEIDDEKLLIKVQNHPEFNSNIDAKELNFLVMKIEDEEGGNIDFSEGKLLKEEKRSVVDYDNRDDRTTELFFDNGDSVEVDVIELYDNLKENNPEDLAENKLLKEDMSLTMDELEKLANLKSDEFKSSPKKLVDMVMGSVKFNLEKDGTNIENASEDEIDKLRYKWARLKGLLKVKDTFTSMYGKSGVKTNTDKDLLDKIK